MFRILGLDFGIGDWGLGFVGWGTLGLKFRIYGLRI